MRNNKKITGIIALVICIVFIVMTVVPMVMTGFAADNVSGKKQELNQLAEKKKQLQQEINSVKNDKNQEMAYKDKLLDEIAITKSEITALNGLIDSLETQASQKQTEINELQVKQNNQLAKFKTRVRAMYEEGDSSYIEVLLSSQSYFFFLSHLEIVTSIIERDNKLIDEIKETSRQVKAAKQEIDDSISQKATAKQQVQEKKSDLEQKNKESQIVINKLDSDAQYLAQQYAINEKEEKKVQQEINALLAASSGGSYVGGEFLWPCPGHTTITSPYGMRYHPTLHVNKLHTGMDIGAPGGAKVVAANGGKVIKATYSSAYGNYVVIDHGGGKATLYAHMSKLSVSAGQSITRGQQVGLVGSTGYSTGNHLHFEVLINGKTVNPKGYV